MGFLRATARGDRAAELLVRGLYHEHGDAVFAYALRALGDRAQAEDVVQETMLRAWRHADRLDPERPVRPWLFAVARNLVIDRRRAAGARPATATAADAELLPGADELERALESWQVAEALRRLTDEHRRVIVETYYRGWSVREAADRLGVPEGTVKSRLYYGLRALRLALEEMGVVA